MQKHPANLILGLLGGLFGFQFLASCQSTPHFEATVLNDDGVVVKMQAVRNEEAFAVDWIEVSTGGRKILRSVDVVVFDDKNGNQVFENGESIGSWHADSGVLSDHFYVSGMLSERVLPPDVLSRLFISSKVEGIVSEDNPDSTLFLSEQNSFPER